jgi:hypothetical protein
MRKILVIVLLLVLAFLGGWITFERDPGQASFTIDTEKVTEDSRQALESGKQVLQEGGESIRDLADSE